MKLQCKECDAEVPNDGYLANGLCDQCACHSCGTPLGDDSWDGLCGDCFDSDDDI